MKPDARTNPTQVLLDQVWALRPNWEKPEKFHEGKSDIIAGLKRLIIESGAVPGDALAVATEKTELALPPKTTLPPLELAASADDVSAESPAPIDEPINEPEADPPGFVEDPGQLESTPPVLASTAAPVADLIELQRGIRSAVAVVADVLTDVEKLALSARASVAAYATALAVLQQTPTIVSPMAPCPSPTLASPLTHLTDTDPQTLYRRSDLLTEKGRVIATRLWVDGLTKRDIAECFDCHGATGPACVSAAIATFLHTHYPWEIAVSTGERGKELAQRALLLIEDPPKRSNGHAQAPLPPPVVNASLPGARDDDDGHGDEGLDDERYDEGNRDKGHDLVPVVGPESDLPVLPPGRYQPTDLRTPSGRARAAELWADGYRQRTIGNHFGIQKSCEPHISLAIGAFLREQLGPFQAAGDARKPLIRAALIKFQEFQESHVV